MLQSISSEPLATIPVVIEGNRVTVPANISVAVALLLQDLGHTRTTPAKETPRAPYCMMGACFDCLVEIDGVPNVQACMTTVRAGMTIMRQLGAGTLRP